MVGRSVVMRERIFKTVLSVYVGSTRVIDLLLSREGRCIRSTVFYT